MSNSTLIIAEAGVNHNGSLDLAMELVEKAQAAGADIVKFQTFRAENVVAASAPKAAYQKASTGGEESQLDMVRRLELDRTAHLRLREECERLGIEFLSTPFDPESAELLVKELGIRRMKIPSGEVTNAPFVLALARYRLPMIVSTGMCTLADVENCLALIAFALLEPKANPTPAALVEALVSREGQAAIEEHVTLLHCTTEYPSAYADTNLRAMDTMALAFGVPVGLSDHTPGIAIPIGAVARGASVVEKHFTTDRALPGPDHLASLDPFQLGAMVEGIRAVESAIGDGRKIIGEAERRNRAIARRSLVALQPVAKGNIWSEENLGAKRPGTGISPFAYWSLLGKPASRDYMPDDVLDAQELSHA